MPASTFQAWLFLAASLATSPTEPTWQTAPNADAPPIHLAITEEQLSEKLSSLTDASNSIERLLGASSSSAYAQHELCSVYELLDQLPASSLPISEPEAAATSAIIRNTADFLRTVAVPSVNHRSVPENSNVEFVCSAKHSSVDTILVTQLGQPGDDNGFAKIYESDSVKLYGNCFVDERVHAGFVVHPNNTSPLRPLPDVGFPLTGFNVVDMFLLPTHAEIQSGLRCDYGQFFDRLVMETCFSSLKTGPKLGCGRWDDVRRSWSTEDCLMNTAFFEFFEEVRNCATCVCDTSGNGNAETYIVYSYFEDVDMLVRFNEVDLAVKNSSDVTELREYERLIGDLANSSPSGSLALETLLSNYLYGVMQFDDHVLQHNCSRELLENIGRVVEGVEPEDGRGIVGRHNDMLAAVVVDVATYDRDPPIAFSVYPDLNLLTYYRSQERIDLNTLFISKFLYSFMFSGSVIAQNCRYAFLLYSGDTYVKPTTTVDGHRVIYFEVLDLWLVPRANVTDAKEQLVHMYYMNTALDLLSYDYGCAIWSAQLDAWATRGCRRDPELYRGVCTCRLAANPDGSRTRSQLLVFKYRNEVVWDVRASGFPVLHLDFIYRNIFELHQLRRKYSGRAGLVQKAVYALSQVFEDSEGNTLLLDADAQTQIIADIRDIIAHNACETNKSEGYTNDGCEVVCYEPASSFSDDHHTWFYYSITRYPGALFDVNPTDAYDAGNLFNTRASYAVRASDSTTSQNYKFAFLVYPADKVPFNPPPSVPGYRIISSRVVDVILVPGDATDSGVEQFVEIYLDQSAFENSTLQCAYWSRTLGAWTTSGCGGFLVGALRVCNCSLTAHFDETPTGGQYAAYTYSTITFDEDVFARLGSRSLADADVIFAQGAALIRNASLLPNDRHRVAQTLSVFLRVLSLERRFLLAKPREVAGIMADIEVLFDRYLVNRSRPVTVDFGIEGSWSAKSSEVAQDLFSNAVLAAADGADVALTTYMTVVALGYFSYVDAEHRHGFRFYGDSAERFALAGKRDTPESLVKNDTKFACLSFTREALCNHRFVFLVYPLNVSPFPRSMTNHSIFNSRQMDVYKSTDDLQYIYSSDYELVASTAMHLYFQPSAAPESYVKVSCAAWDDRQQAWTNELCQAVIEFGHDHICRCELINRTATQVIVYEYTDTPNFSLVERIKPSTIIFLVGATLSLVGFAMITTTAILFAKWRSELGNKILLHLTASSFLYLALTTYRETHVIFADTNHDDVALIVFTVAVHYTRLAHFCWGLAMSVLQYRRFSSLVGAKDTSHLLLKVAAPAWGAPLLPLAVLLSWRPVTHFCTADKMTHYALYLVPGAVVSALNLALMVAIVYKISNKCGCGHEGELRRSNVAGVDLLKRRIKTVVLMFFVFGIPTVFELCNDLGSHVAGVEYVGKLLDPVQGFVMFVFFVVCDETSRRCWNVRMGGWTWRVSEPVARWRLWRLPGIPRAERGEMAAGSEAAVEETPV